MTDISATSLSWKTLAACGLAILLGLLMLDSHAETYICQQSVALPYNRATVFKFISDMRTLPGVILLFNFVLNVMVLNPIRDI